MQIYMWCLLRKRRWFWFEQPTNTPEKVDLNKIATFVAPFTIYKNFLILYTKYYRHCLCLSIFLCLCTYFIYYFICNITFVCTDTEFKRNTYNHLFYFIIVFRHSPHCDVMPVSTVFLLYDWSCMQLCCFSYIL